MGTKALISAFIFGAIGGVLRFASSGVAPGTGNARAIEAAVAFGCFALALVALLVGVFSVGSGIPSDTGHFTESKHVPDDY